MSSKIVLVTNLLVFFYSLSSYSWWAWTPGDHVDDSTQSLLVPGYRPDQPIPFSHKLHAGERNIPCEYCHSSARRSPSAGIPPSNTCMGCHKIVNTEASAIKEITNKYNNNEAIQWTRVHDLPDYVRFSHQVHVLAKDSEGNNLLSCETCHGNVKSMTVVEQWAPLQMGWCIECHNTPRENIKEDDIHKTYAPVSCNTCHY